MDPLLPRPAAADFPPPSARAPLPLPSTSRAIPPASPGLLPRSAFPRAVCIVTARNRPLPPETSAAVAHARSQMNPLTKNKRGRTQPRSAPATCALVAGSTATRAQVGDTSANQDVGVAPQSGVSPFGFVAPRPGAPPVGFVPPRPGAPPVGFVPPRPGPGASPVGSSWPVSSPSEGLYPPGGFSNFLESNPFANHPNGTENSHFVGAGMSQSSVSPQYMSATRTPSPAQQTDNMVDDLDAEENETNNIPDDSRTDKRLNWSVPEDIRLASAWLHNSKDPVDGNGRKADAYWTDVTEEYNKTTESNRKRNRNQLKIRWDRCKKPLSDFHGSWVNASRVWQSGMSDDQLTDKALEMWSSRNNNKAFHLLHMWKVVRGEQKWSAYLARLKKETEKSAKDNPAQVVNFALEGEKRPVGHKKTKKELNGKRKTSDALADFNEKFDKFIETSTKNREEREKMTEVQQSLADKKIEAARINHEAAHEQIKAAHEQTK